jgi:hypothetical protein
MRNLRNRLSRHLNVRAILAGLALFATSGVALALTVPASFSPRMFPSQQTHYLRFSFNFNSCVLASGSCTLKVGAVPYNAWVLRAYQQIVTSFNSLTSDNLSIGVTSTSANELVANQSIAAAAGGATALTVISTAAGTVKTGDLATSTNTIGSGFDIWVKWTQVGTAASAGAANYIIEYAAPNDGSCALVPQGSTAAAC